MRFRDIPQFPQSYYKVDVGLDYLVDHLAHWNYPDAPLILNPEWQRGHVWSKEQQIAFMEYFLKGGRTGSELYFNCSSWSSGYNTPIYCVDGLQRLTAALAFINNEIPVFGGYRKEYTDNPRITHNNFHMNMLAIKNKKELLNVYLDFNSGGTPHNQSELDRVQLMIDSTPETETL